MNAYAKMTKAELIRCLERMSSAAAPPPLVLSHRRPTHTTGFHPAEAEEQNSSLRLDDSREPATPAVRVTDRRARSEPCGDKEALAESLALNTAILDSLPAHIAVLDGRGNITAVNRAWTRFAQENGATDPGNTGVGTNYLGVCRRAARNSALEAAQVCQSVESVLSGKLDYFQIEYPCHSAETIRWFVMTVTPLLGSKAGAVVAHVDISQRRQAEEALENQAQRLRAILDTAVEGIITIDEQGTIEIFNQAAEAIFGYPAREVIGKNVKILMPSPHREAHDRYLSNYHHAGARKIIGTGREVSGRRKDGSTFPMELAVSEALLSSGRLFIGIIRDITAKKEAAARLRESEERRQLILETSEIGTFEVDTETGATYWNPMEFRLLGLKPNECLPSAETFFSYVHPSDIKRVRQQYQTALDTGRFESEFRIIRADGEQRWLAGRGRLVQDKRPNSGSESCPVRPSRFLGIHFDITVRKQTEAEYQALESEIVEISEQEQRRIGRDLHDGLGQQLAGLEMICHALQEELPHDPPDLRRKAGRMGELLREAISQTRALAHCLAPAVISREGLSGALHQLADSMSLSSRVRCTFKGDAKAHVRDSQTATHLFRIAQEAISNAIRHSQGHLIVLELKQRKDQVVLTIQDDGRGLPKKPKTKGGLGLGVMRHRAHLIGGTLEIRSRSGAGVCVSCTLPVESHED